MARKRKIDLHTPKKMNPFIHLLFGLLTALFLILLLSFCLNVGIRYTAFHLGKVSLDGVGRDVSLTGLSAILLVSTTFLWGYLQ